MAVLRVWILTSPFAELATKASLLEGVEKNGDGGGESVMPLGK